MRMFLGSLAVALALGTSPVLASECPLDMKKIDAALAGDHGLNPVELAKAKTLRAQGEASHTGGRHAESVKTLREVMGMLGIE